MNEKILSNVLISPVKKETRDIVYETYRAQPKEVRLLAYKILVDKFNEKSKQ